MADLGRSELSLSLPSFLEVVSKQHQGSHRSVDNGGHDRKQKSTQHLEKLPKTSLLHPQRPQKQAGAAGASRGRRDTADVEANSQLSHRTRRGRRNEITILRSKERPPAPAAVLQRPSTPKVLSQALEKNTVFLQRRTVISSASSFAGDSRSEAARAANAPHGVEHERPLVYHATIAFDSTGTVHQDTQQAPSDQRGTTVESKWDVLSRPLTAYTVMPSSSAVSSRPLTAGDADTLLLYTSSAVSSASLHGQSVSIAREVAAGREVPSGTALVPHCRPRSPRDSDLNVVLVGKPALLGETYASEHGDGGENGESNTTASHGFARPGSAGLIVGERSNVSSAQSGKRRGSAGSSRGRRGNNESFLKSHRTQKSRNTSITQLQPYYLTDSESDGENTEQQQRPDDASQNLGYELGRENHDSEGSFTTGRTTTTTDDNLTRPTTRYPEAVSVDQRCNFSSIEEVDSVLNKYASLLSERQRQLARLGGAQEMVELENQYSAPQFRLGSASVKFAAAVRKAPRESRPASGLSGQNQAPGTDMGLLKERRPGSSTSGGAPMPNAVLHQDDGKPLPWMPPLALLDDLQQGTSASRPWTATSAESTGGDSKTVQSFTESSKWVRRGGGVYEFNPGDVGGTADGLSPWEHDEGGIDVYDVVSSPDYEEGGRLRNGHQTHASNAVLVDLSETRRTLSVTGAASREVGASATGMSQRVNRQSTCGYLDRQRERLRIFEQKRRTRELVDTQKEAMFSENIPHHHRPNLHGEKQWAVAAVKGVSDQPLHEVVNADAPVLQTSPSQEPSSLETPAAEEPKEDEVLVGRKIQRARKMISTESLLLRPSTDVVVPVGASLLPKSEAENAAANLWSMLPLLRYAEETKAARRAKRGTLRSRSQSQGRRTLLQKAKERPITAFGPELSNLIGGPVDLGTPDELPVDSEPPILIVDGRSLAMPSALLSRPLTGKTRYTPAPARMQFGAGLRVGTPSGVPVSLNAELDLFTPFTHEPSQDASSINPHSLITAGTEPTSEHAGGDSEFSVEDYNYVMGHGTAATGASTPGFIPSTPRHQHATRTGDIQAGLRQQLTGLHADHGVQPSTWINPLPQAPQPQAESDQRKPGESAERPFEGRLPGMLAATQAEVHVRPEDILEDPRYMASLEQQNLVGPISHVCAMSSEKSVEADQSLYDVDQADVEVDSDTESEGESYCSAESGRDGDRLMTSEEEVEDIDHSTRAFAARAPSAASTRAFEKERSNDAGVAVELRCEEQQRLRLPTVSKPPIELLGEKKPIDVSEEKKSAIEIRIDEPNRTLEVASDVAAQENRKMTATSFASNLVGKTEAPKLEATKTVEFAGLSDSTVSFDASYSGTSRPQTATSEGSGGQSRKSSSLLPQIPSTDQTALEEIADRLRTSSHGSARQKRPKSAEPKPNGPMLYDLVFNAERRKKTVLKMDIARYPALADKEAHILTPETPLPGTPSHALKERGLMHKIEEVTWQIRDQKEIYPGLYIERAWLYAENKMLEDALQDLAVAIANSGVGMAIDARWLRAQIWLLMDHTELALKDLEAITDSNKSHFGAFQAKARIYQELDMVKLAIVNYSQVIRLRPDDADGYYARGCLFEQENEAVYADEDFNMVRKLDSSNTHALLKHAMHCFERELWEDSVRAFTSLINAVPEFATAYALRGRACAYLQVWEAALEDLTRAIQLAPDRADFFFHRGCLLCERNRKKALEDFGVSLLLDDSPRNARVYFYRALVYSRTKRKDMAMIDFHNVVEREPENAAAHLNLAILYMEHSHNSPKALQCFNNAILHDPTNTRAYLCRGELYQRMHETY